MAISSSGNLMDTLRQHQLLSPEQLAQMPNLAQGRCGSARSLAKLLLQRSWLSVYQVNQLLLGNGRELIIGPYYVIDRLGQGGLSSVYKGRHRDTGQLVAIKMIKPEVFASPEGRQQFLQEVEAMARLDHPNIVQFCDADQVNDTYYFAMEYVDGTDLGKVVRLSGALPVQEACDYVRQAALGLQHAYERNLVHRDIKPVNLFLTHESVQPSAASQLFAIKQEPGPTKPTLHAKAVIKILDWGLACPGAVRGVAAQPCPGVVGTADYLSPEQARNANAVDIRSDIYSLGCTLYFLLTGQPPFPDGSLIQKIIQHQQGEPKPIEEFRKSVPAALVGIVKRMMAKQPEERFQTPASTALALLPFTRKSPDVRSSGMLPTLKGILAARGKDETPLPAALVRLDEEILRLPGRNADGEASGVKLK